jgi:hypothetical protein
LALGAQLERGQADIWQRENGSRARRLSLAVPDLMARPLELPPDVDLGGIEVDICPGEPQRFSTSQTENENQHVGRVQRVMIAPGGFQKGAGLLDRPPLPLWFARIEQSYDRGDVTGKQLFGDSVGERGAECIAEGWPGVRTATIALLRRWDGSRDVKGSDPGSVCSDLR